MLEGSLTTAAHDGQHCHTELAAFQGVIAVGCGRRYVPVPKVSKEDRLLFTALPIKGLYRCVARYG